MRCQLWPPMSRHHPTRWHTNSKNLQKKRLESAWSADETTTMLAHHVHNPVDLGCERLRNECLFDDWSLGDAVRSELSGGTEK
jgi:hypothetical protein